MDAIDCGIQRIPPEILTLFFLECIPQPTRHHPGPILSRTHPAAVVSHVCHEWRELALGTPCLWSGMHIRTPSLDHHGSHPLQLEGWLLEAAAVREAIVAWTERSAGHPLSIVFEVLGISLPEECFWMHLNIFRDVIRCSQRWREIHINIQEPRFIAVRYLNSVITDLLPAAEFPSLTSFSLFLTPNEGRYIMRLWLCSTFLKSKLFSGPKLRAVSLGGHWELPNMQLGEQIEHWTSLTELTIEPYQLPVGQQSTPPFKFSAHHALQLIRHLTRLTSISFVLQHEEPGQIVQYEPPMTLLNLQELSLRGVPMGSGFAQSLILPSLTSMYLAFNAYDKLNGAQDPSTLAAPVGYGEGILELLRRFAGQLTALALDPIPLTLSSFPSCLDYLDSGRLETLRLIDGDFAAPHPNVQGGAAARRELTHAALVYLANPGVLPNLKRFGVALRDDPSQLCEGALAEVVDGRRRMEVTAEKGRQEE